MSERQPQLSGAVFLKNLDAFREFVGEDVVGRALDRLTPEHRSTIDTTVAVAWIDSDVVDAAYSAIALEAGQDLEPLYRRVVYEGVSRTLKSVWRVLLRIHSDKALVARTPQIYARGHSLGSIEPKITGPGRAEIHLSGWPGMPRLRRIGVAMGIEAVLHIAGRDKAQVVHAATPDGARFDATW